MEGKYLSRLRSIDDEVKLLDDMSNKSERQSTMDMHMIESIKYTLWDNELNLIYKDIIQNMKPDIVDRVNADEAKWISSKDDNANKAADKVKGGTLEPIYRLQSLADSTRTRCYELLNDY